MVAALTVVLVLALTLMGLPGPAAAEERAPAVEPVVETGMPLEIVDQVWLPERGAWELEVVNNGDRLITAWVLECVVQPLDPRVQPALTRLTLDQYLGLEMTRDSVPTPVPDTSDGFQVGERQVEILPCDPPGYSVHLRVTAVVYDDLATEGSAEQIDEIFRKRAKALARTTESLEVIETALAQVTDPASGLEALRGLVETFEIRFGRSRSSRGAPTTLVNLARSLKESERDPSAARRGLEAEVLGLRFSQRAGERHVPSQYRESAQPGSSNDETALPRTEPSSATSCDLGATVTTSTFVDCNWAFASGDIRVEELWRFTDPDGSTGAGNLTGTGRCEFALLGYRECWPEFHGPSVATLVGPLRVRWFRDVSNRVVYAVSSACRNSSSADLLHEAECTDGSPCDDLADAGNLWFPCDTEPPDGNPPGGGGGGGGNDGEVGPSGTPILLDLDRDGFRLTDLDGGVRFDVDSDGVRERMSWTALTSRDAFLYLDLDGDGLAGFGKELFGHTSEQSGDGEANGYAALEIYDWPALGGNGDRWIDAADAVFRNLRLWVDVDHDGVCEAAEVTRLGVAGVAAIGLDPRLVRESDEHGNLIRYQGPFTFADGSTGLAADVFFWVAE